MPEEIDSPKQQEPNPLDVLLVYNPDINCDIIDTEDNYPHKEYFQVKWSGHPHRVAPGKVKRMPRFLAEHFAKHLANHILIKMEEETGRKGLMQSPVERPRILKQILLGVDTYFLGEQESDPGEKVAQMVDTMNPEEKFVDLGDVPNPTIGVLIPEPKPVVITEEVVLQDVVTTSTNPLPVEGNSKSLPQTDTSIWNDEKPKPTRKQLFADCEKLGITVTGKETVDQLVEKIKKILMSDRIIKPDDKLDGVKTFSFSNEELEMLKPRQEIIDMHRVVLNDINLWMQQYIVTVVIPRLGIDPNRYDVNFNVRTNKLTCTPKPPEIIKPDNKIVVPK